MKLETCKAVLYLKYTCLTWLECDKLLPPDSNGLPIILVLYVYAFSQKTIVNTTRTYIYIMNDIKQ